jgi:hypothetical protein
MRSYVIGTDGVDDITLLDGFGNVPEGTTQFIVPGGTDGTEDVINLAFAEGAKSETIVINLDDTFGGARVAINGFDIEQDRIALDFGSSGLTLGSGETAITVTRVMVEDLANFTIDPEAITDGVLNLFAVEDADGAGSILYATDGYDGGEVAYLDNVTANQLATSLALYELNDNDPLLLSV